jgi:hypothetical protein
MVVYSKADLKKPCKPFLMNMMVMLVMMRLNTFDMASTNLLPRYLII